ncbi:hypothetical protein BpHYR1_018868 [Brachionus plicatilis]|uniref:Uncharacterized protein n=1 Tax=Brachionus plicatilis TaxID=10195 RepID=A0A3M7PUC5_BRAPC|nr:hypothetical protein BpHYR1_018868 [Brachionus plicatilis]
MIIYKPETSIYYKTTQTSYIFHRLHGHGLECNGLQLMKLELKNAFSKLLLLPECLRTPSAQTSLVLLKILGLKHF